jgi:glycosyltransferase involved in cell wall biosynthesis
VFLSTAEEEGFPNTFTQAWSAGTPVVSLRLDPDHLIERIGMGRVPDTIDDTVAHISDLLRSPRRRDEIATRARRFITENYSATAVVKIFQGALNNRPA